jgi:hypothetical protein
MNYNGLWCVADREVLEEADESLQALACNDPCGASALRDPG